VRMGETIAARFMVEARAEWISVSAAGTARGQASGRRAQACVK